MFHSQRSVGIVFLLLGASCAGAPPKHLVDARRAYQNASQGPAAELAPAQLHAAKVSLTLAERTYDDEGESANARDRAYVAMRKAELANVQAKISAQAREIAQQEQRGEMAQQAHHAATEQQLEQTRGQLDSEIKRREQAEQAQKNALQALGDVKKEPRGTVLTIPGTVSFASGQAELLPGARNRLERVADALKLGDPSSKIIVEGHTDATGAAALNEQLSEKRAASVQEELVSNGVPPERIEVVGYGETRPVADNASPAGRATNRRVEIVVQENGEASSNPAPDANSANSPSDQAPRDSANPPSQPPF